MYKTRKSSGSASFLNRLQRNAQFSSAGGAEDGAEDATPAVTPEALLELLAELHETTVQGLAELTRSAPEALFGPLGELMRNDCIKVSGDIANPASAILITPIGAKTASYAKIARA